MKSMYSNEMFQSQMSTMTDNGIPLISIGMYVMYGAAIPLLLTIGNYLIHKGTKHAKNSLFAQFDAVKKGNVYCTGKNFFQESTGMAEFVEDMHNVLGDADADLTYLKKLN